MAHSRECLRGSYHFHVQRAFRQSRVKGQPALGSQSGQKARLDLLSCNGRFGVNWSPGLQAKQL